MPDPQEIVALNMRRGLRLRRVQRTPEEAAKLSAALVARMEEEQRIREGEVPPPEQAPAEVLDPTAAAYQLNEQRTGDENQSTAGDEGQQPANLESPEQVEQPAFASQPDAPQPKQGKGAKGAKATAPVAQPTDDEWDETKNPANA